MSVSATTYTDVRGDYAQDENEEQIPPQPYENAKFYTPMRWRLAEVPLTSSALAVFVGLHTLCDANTGHFVPDHAALREILRMPKSTVHAGWNRLLETSLIRETDNGEYVIADYEADRLSENASYFRLTTPFLRSLGLMVAHHNAPIIRFALELLDGSRAKAPEIRRKIRTLVKKRKLGSCRSRVFEALALLGDWVRWSSLPSETGTDEVVQFWPVREERAAAQDEWRAMHGAVTQQTLHAFSFAKGQNRPKWTELSRYTRAILQYGYDQNLRTGDILRLGGLWGSILARHQIRRRLAYLRRILANGDLLRSSQALQRAA